MRRADADMELSDADESAVGGVVEGEFEEDNMAALAKIVTSVGARIVLSTTWRETAAQRRAVDRQLQSNGLPKHSGVTPSIPHIYGSSQTP